MINQFVDLIFYFFSVYVLHSNFVLCNGNYGVYRIMKNQVSLSVG